MAIAYEKKKFDINDVIASCCAFALDHPILSIVVCTFGCVFIEEKLIEHAVYKGCTKANKKTVEYISYLNNQIIY